MVLNVPNVVSNNWLFKTSPMDFEQKHYEGKREIPGTPGGITTTGWKGTGTTTTDGAEDKAWINPNNTQTSNDTYSTATTTAPLGDTVQSLKAVNFSFAVPTGATILGVEVNIERKTDFNNEVRDKVVKLSVGGSATGTGQSTMAWTTTERTDTIGSSSEMWGTTLSIAQVNAADFGVFIQPEVYAGGGNNVLSIDYIQIRVHYQT